MQNKVQKVEKLIPKFHYWVQQVMPLVFDDSLSYYEVLCKVTDTLNKIIEELDLQESKMIELTNAFNTLKNYVDNYFDSLDVQEEINNKLDKLVEDGTLTEIVMEAYNLWCPSIETEINLLGGTDTTEVTEDIAIESIINLIENNKYQKPFILKNSNTSGLFNLNFHGITNGVESFVFSSKIMIDQNDGTNNYIENYDIVLSLFKENNVFTAYIIIELEAGEYLRKNNTQEFNPVSNSYNPATTKYVDNKISEIDEDLEDLDNKIDSIRDLIYPVGSIYIAANNISPETIYGGTWEAIEGKFLLSSSNDYTLGSTGGESTHTLTINEMPSHYHNSSAASVTGGGTNYAGVVVGITGGDDVHNQITQSTGGSQAHNNMPPYLVVNAWKRIS